MTTAIDLFAGLGGWSTGAKQAGIHVIWAANHWPAAIKWHSANHPETKHVCQDLHQADWTLVPNHDVMLASPCCQGHSRARGKANGNPQHDASRSTAWAVVSAAEFHRQPLIIVENVPEFLQWTLYPAWSSAMEALGYTLSSFVVDCADLGVPQNRNRLFIMCTRSKAKLSIKLPRLDHSNARNFIEFDSGNWSPVNKPGRAIATLSRINNGRKSFGDRFVMPYYKSGSGLTGRSLDRPIGTITTKARWGVVKENQMRMLTVEETMAAMSFSRDTKLPKQKNLAIHLAGNAVPPLAGEHVLKAVLAAA